MDNILTQSNITFVLGVLAVIFSVYIYFRKPQEEMDKRQAVIEKETEGKAAILAQQLQWEKDSNERRFKELVEGLNMARSMSENHIHSIDVKVDNLSTLVNSMNVEMGNKITELGTIINERIPKRIV